MKQVNVKSVPAIIVLATIIIGALEQFAAAIGLLHVTKTTFEAACNELVAARDSLQAGRVELATRRATLRNLVQAARAFVTQARDVLKPTLGKQHSPTWASAGFDGSFAVPYTAEQMLVKLQLLKTFFTGNATLEVPQFNITAARALVIFNDLSDALLDVQEQVGVVNDLVAVQSSKFDKVQELVRALFGELKLRLQPMDGTWVKFGFNRPGAISLPTVPKNLLALLIGPATVALKWDRAERAAHYRVWKKVIGVDEEFVSVGSPSDLDFLIENLPANATVHIAVSAVNESGESVKTEAVIITTA